MACGTMHEHALKCLWKVISERIVEMSFPDWVGGNVVFEEAVGIMMGHISSGKHALSHMAGVPPNLDWMSMLSDPLNT